MPSVDVQPLRLCRRRLQTVQLPPSRVRPPRLRHHSLSRLNRDLDSRRPHHHGGIRNQLIPSSEVHTAAVSCDYGSPPWSVPKRPRCHEGPSRCQPTEQYGCSSTGPSRRHLTRPAGSYWPWPGFSVSPPPLTPQTRGWSARPRLCYRPGTCQCLLRYVVHRLLGDRPGAVRDSSAPIARRIELLGLHVLTMSRPHVSWRCLAPRRANIQVEATKVFRRSR
jgi:hypothetical protein